MKKKEIDAIKRNKGHMLSGAAVLAIGSVLAKVLGALYRVPLKIGRASCRERV